MTSISPRTTHELPRLYAWDVRDGDTGRSGVTSDRNVALGHVHHFVRAGASGARGKVRQVGLSPTGGTEYVGLRIIGEAWLDEMSGAVVWVG